MTMALTSHDTAIAPRHGLRYARPDDLAWVVAHLQQAIDASPYYGDTFKAQEKKRYSSGFLRNLISVDPWHVAIADHQGEAAGFVITIPDFGNLWSTWIYALPEFRRSTISLTMLREAVAHWDNGRFHKASCYVKPENTAARTLFRRYGFREVALLERHVVGEDFLLLERDLTKVIDGYDSGVNVGRLGRLRMRLQSLRGGGSPRGA